ncbi:phosphoribosylanthranilate isomerase [Effusibacillus dendaii]|uniref:N-(5'-phosphoribosyl)anthranilate isomerase n=1 Tax=Effusibacillus dendaii TaxID=2743772 RepID=A0A7I8DBU4_9BACL|nr:phosphoribosylanthranilate isomerase [Effusibacillus dendaii]BCJ85401.1 N-(5'-phosphoribosyl)anthranilate isomerase [Effusibacillus dendaii]
MTQIKICGLMTKEAVECAAQAGIDYIGFVFAESKRRVTAEQVADLCAGVQTPKRIGVFVNATLRELLTIGEQAGLDGFQLHGDESPDFCRELRAASGKPVWKSWSVKSDGTDGQIADFQTAVDAVLLDTYQPGAKGGTGQTFDWQAIDRFRELLPNIPILVAGGLSAQNVGELVKNYRPYGVDVSSGVETDGVKDIEKMNLFIQKVREQS